MIDFKRFLNDSNGNVAIIFALLSFPLFGFIGAAIDTAKVYSAQKQLQDVVDSAALAGASKVGAQDDQRKKIAESFLDTNVDQLSFPVTAKSVAAADGMVKVIASYDYPTAVLKLFGIDTLTVATSSSAQAQVYEDGHLCILALNEHQSDSFHIQGNNEAIAENCWVWVNSSSSAAISGVGTSMATAKGFCTKGKVDGVEHFTPAPGTDCNAMTDPFEQQLNAYNFAYEDDDCLYEDLVLKRGTHILKPGVYCGDTVFKPHAHVTFTSEDNKPYVIRDGELQVQAGASLKSGDDGVAIVFTGENTKFTVRGGADVDLKAPSKGKLAGFLLIDRKSDGSSSTIEDTIIRGGGTLKFEGLVYAPQWRIIISGNSLVNGATECFAMVADRFRMEGNGELKVKAECENAGLPQLMPKVKSVPLMVQ